MRRPLPALLLLALSFGASSLAGSRARYGGTLKVAAARTSPPSSDPLESDAPVEAAQLSLISKAVCRLDAKGNVRGQLAQEMGRVQQGSVRISLRPNLQDPDGRPIDAQAVLAAWSRLTAPATASPYRALFAPVRGDRKNLEAQVLGPLTFDLPLAYPWPDLERSLCHPALAVGSHGGPGASPFLPAPAQGVHVANGLYPEGRPYLDRLTVTTGDERTVARQFSLRQATVALGTTSGPGQEGPALYTTYLAFNPKKVSPSFRQAFESTVERTDLVRFFVRGPATPVFRLLPPALMPQDIPVRPPAPEISAQALTLTYDASSETHRAVAERLQVKLHERGYTVALKALPRATLRARWAADEHELSLVSLLLPPAPAPALAVAIEASGRGELLSRELPAIGLISEPSARDAKARERASALERELPLVPLFSQALKVQVAPPLSNLSLDGFGLPLFDEAFFSDAP